MRFTKAWLLLPPEMLNYSSTWEQTESNQQFADISPLKIVNAAKFDEDSFKGAVPARGTTGFNLEIRPRRNIKECPKKLKVRKHSQQSHDESSNNDERVRKPAPPIRS